MEVEIATRKVSGLPSQLSAEHMQEDNLKVRLGTTSMPERSKI